MRNSKIQRMAIAALLSAMGIVIPMFAPKIMLDPASYTLASHVPVFIAMFISPFTAISVSIISSIGFLLAAFPIIIVARALTHVIFASVGAFILTKNKNLLHNKVTLVIFVVLISILHGACELLIATPYYMGGTMAEAYTSKGYLISIVGFVGLGTVIHSIVDFFIAYVVWKPLGKVVNVPVSFRFKSK